MIIGVAGPYSADTAEQRQQNLDKLNTVAAMLLELGHVPIIGMNAALPVVDQANVKDRYQSIMDISLAVVGACDALLLIAESPGANKERDLMLSMGKPVYTSIEEVIAGTADFEIVSTRVFNYAKEFLFSAWSNPAHLKNWWGPNGFTNTFNEFDFRPGGKWSFIMHGPDKGNYVNEVEFTKIEAPNFIAWKRFSKPLFNVSFTFEEVTDKSTKVVFKMIFNSIEECNKIKAFAVDKNEENFDRLEVELAKMASES